MAAFGMAKPVGRLPPSATQAGSQFFHVCRSCSISVWEEQAAVCAWLLEAVKSVVVRQVGAEKSPHEGDRPA